MDQLRVGFIGAGQISELHAAGYGEVNPRARLVAVADANAEVATRRGEQWRLCHVFTNYRDLLDCPDVDAVEILLPHHLHAEAACAALRAGKHVSLQKPPALTLAQVDTIDNATSHGESRLRVFENFRSFEPFQRARELLRSGEIGEPLSIRVKTIEGRGVGGWVQPDSARAWRRRLEEGGGAPSIIDHGYHLISIALYLMGPIERVHAMIGSPDGIPAQVIWQHAGIGAPRFGSWETVRAAELPIPTKRYAEDEWCEVTGTRGVLWVTHCSGNLLGAPSILVHRDGELREIDDLEKDWDSSFVRGTREFTDGILDGLPMEMSLTEARHVLAVALAILLSGRERREVVIEELG
ncbi:MAG: Gfo/Idh/MocA family oxidoreductase [Candidatus Latescibacterota bacterium]|nr:Gfo/Idh/MocA family oxidoreductase [Candidatus Latescibacterota bacterium]